jgi:uncharacterized membrane protein YcgQ (UPF0703/DUF1980 family)
MKMLDTWGHLKVWLKPKTKISKKESNRLKEQIRYRLRHEDYTCRLPRLPKPRIRYKLKKVKIIGFFTKPNRFVYK